MHRHPKRPAWIVADELAPRDEMPTGNVILFRYDAVTAMCDYDDGTLMVWTNTDAGFFVGGTVDELLNLTTTAEIPPLPMGDGTSVPSDAFLDHLARITKENQ
jgi:hypothetical protein